jgi:high-affinity iron transporter
MLIATGVLIGIVLVVMIGGTAATFQDLGWLPRHATPFAVPQWMGAWFEIYPTWETLAVQFTAALFVVGSYFAAERRVVAAPQRRGEEPAIRAEAPPVTAA